MSKQRDQPMLSRAEQTAGRLLRTMLGRIPVGGSLLEARELNHLFGCLEYFIPQILAEIYSDWEHESLDGFIPLIAEKSADQELELYGLCIIISDQTTTPVHLRLQASSSKDEITWMECRLGEVDANGMVREKWRLKSIPKQLFALEGRADKICWRYKATYGQRRA